VIYIKRGVLSSFFLLKNYINNKIKIRRMNMKTNDKIIYEGFFLTASKGFKGSLEREIENKHITTDFFGSNSDKPTHPEFYGMSATFKIIGYANDGKNEGFLIDKDSIKITADYTFDEAKGEFRKNDPKLIKNFIKFYNEAMKDRIPHVTLSVSKDGKPVDTKDLEFEPVRTPFTCSAIFAGYTDKGELTINFKKPDEKDIEKINNTRCYGGIGFEHFDIDGIPSSIMEFIDAGKFTEECKNDYNNIDNDVDDVE
jgi:hypothetical protein